MYVLYAGSTNKEFSFRHDWNSLISDDETLLMKYYTKDYFPHADVYVSGIWGPVLGLYFHPESIAGQLRFSHSLATIQLPVS